MFSLSRSGHQGPESAPSLGTANGGMSAVDRTLLEAEPSNWAGETLAKQGSADERGQGLDGQNGGAQSQQNQLRKIAVTSAQCGERVRWDVGRNSLLRTMRMSKNED